MARSGTTLDSPVTGERIVFRRTAAESGGAICLHPGPVAGELVAGMPAFLPDQAATIDDW